MAKGLVSDTNLTAIANAIRTKNGSSDRYTPSTMAQAISDIPTSQVDQESALKYMLENKTDYTGIAAGLTTLAALPAFIQTSVNVFDSAFSECTSLVDFSNLDLSAVNSKYDTRKMFYHCSSATTVPNFSTNSEVGTIYAESMFEGCSNLTTVVLSGRYFFRGARSIRRIFFNCKKLTSFNSDSGSYPNLISCSKADDFEAAFYSCSAITQISLGKIGNNPNSGLKTNIHQIFLNCSKLATVKAASGNSVYSMDLSNVYRSSAAFYGCSKLATVPVLNFGANLTNADSIFGNCPSLSSDSLNNILASFVNATNLPTKTLKYIGLSSAQATTCTGLSNWAALSAAGWTTGY